MESFLPFIRTLLLFALLSLPSLSFGQNWPHELPWQTALDTSFAYDVEELNDGDFIVAGRVPGPTGDTAYLARLSPDGIVKWVQHPPAKGLQRATEMPGGTLMTSTFSRHRRPVLAALDTVASVFQYDPTGQLLWEFPFNHPQDTFPMEMIWHSSQRAIIGTFNYHAPIPPDSIPHYRLHLLSLDSAGQVLSDWDFPSVGIGVGGTNWGANLSMTEVGNGDIVLVTRNPSASFIYRVIRVSATGNLIWQKEFTLPTPDVGTMPKPVIREAAKGELHLFRGESRDFHGQETGLYLLRMNAQGDSLSYEDLAPASGLFWAGSFAPMADGGWMVGGQFRANSSDPWKGIIARLDANRNWLWTRYYPGAQTCRNILDLEVCTDQGIVAAATPELGANHFQHGARGFVYRLDTNGASALNLVEGHLWGDLDSNCVLDTHDTNLMGVTVTALTTGAVGVTDPAGYYQLWLPAGTHDITFVPPYQSSLTATHCLPSDTQTVALTGLQDTLSGIDFPLTGSQLNALLAVQVTPKWDQRICSMVAFDVTCSNWGLLSADSAYVDITWDSALAFNSASVPWDSLASNLFRFYPDTLDPMQSISFDLYLDVDCNAPLGLTQCVQAHIYPDSGWWGNLSAWNGASLRVEGNCNGNGEVEFTLENVGTANMLDESGLWVLEDDLLRLVDSVQLDMGEDTIYTFAANGNGWALMVDQVNPHPGMSRPRDFVEACGNNFGNSLGYGLELLTDDLDPYVDIACGELLNSYDPNDKVGYPIGLGEDHLIPLGEALDYRIRFQNTGNDTAYKVVVRDLLPPELDPATLQMGWVSHPYQLITAADGALEWQFDNINLPDSATDPMGSQGVIYFSIHQRPSNQVGDVIKNAADIFFDFNPPIITDTAWHTLGEPGMGYLYPDPAPYAGEGLARLHVYPNPFSEWVRFEIEGAEARRMVLTLYDVQGRRVLEKEGRETNYIQMERGQVGTGIYLYQLEVDGQVWSGKVLNLPK